MTTPAPPRKHLYTLPVVTVLPDPTTVPEGYPVLLEVAGKRSLFQRQGGSFVAAGGGGGGGGGSVKYGELLAATGTPQYTAVPGVDTNNIVRNNGGVFTVPTGSFGNSSLGLDAAGNLVTQAWAFRQTSQGDQRDYAFTVQTPYRNSPGGSDPDPGGNRASRFDFRFRRPAQGRGYFVVMVVDSYDPANTSRVIPVWSEQDYQDSVIKPSNLAARNYYAEQYDDPSDYAPEWGYNGNYGGGWIDQSVTLPPGWSTVTFYTYTSSAYQGPSDRDVKSGDFDGAITDLRFTECDHAGIDPGSLFFETSTQSVWLFDDTIVHHTALAREQALGLAPGGVPGTPDTTRNAGLGGAGWYRIVRPTIQMRYSEELDSSGSQSNTYHLGYHYFGQITDLDGNNLGLSRYGKLAEQYKGRLPAASELTYYEDRFLVKDGNMPTPSYQIDRSSHLTPPTIQSASVAYNSTTPRDVANGASRFYRVAALQSGVTTEGVPSGPFTAINNSGAPRSFSISIAPPPSATALVIYSSDTGAGATDYVKVATVTLDGTGQAIYFFDNTTPAGGAIATPDASTDQTFGAGIFGCGFMDINTLGLGSTAGAGSILTVDSGVTDMDFLVEASHLVNIEMPLRYTDMDNYFSVRTRTNDSTILDVVNRLAGVETVLATITVPLTSIGGFQDFGAGFAPRGYRVQAIGIHLKVTALSNYGTDGVDYLAYDADILTSDHAAATRYGWSPGISYTKLTRLFCVTRGPNPPSDGYPFRLAFNGATKDSVITPMGDNPRIGAFSFSLSRHVVSNFLVNMKLIRRNNSGPYSDHKVLNQTDGRLSFYASAGVQGQSYNLNPATPVTPLSGYQDTIEGWFTVPAPVNNAYQEPTSVELTGHIYFGSQ